MKELIAHLEQLASDKCFDFNFTKNSDYNVGFNDGRKELATYALHVLRSKEETNIVIDSEVDFSGV